MPPALFVRDLFLLDECINFLCAFEPEEVCLTLHHKGQQMKEHCIIKRDLLIYQLAVPLLCTLAGQGKEVSKKKWRVRDELRNENLLQTVSEVSCKSLVSWSWLRSDMMS